VLGVKVNPTLSNELDSDEEFEASLRRELIEIALVHGVTNADTLRDILIAVSGQREVGKTSHSRSALSNLV
jgi:hypothetical protein